MQNLLFVKHYCGPKNIGGGGDAGQTGATSDAQNGIFRRRRLWRGFSCCHQTAMRWHRSVKSHLQAPVQQRPILRNRLCNRSEDINYRTGMQWKLITDKDVVPKTVVLYSNYIKFV